MTYTLPTFRLIDTGTPPKQRPAGRTCSKCDRTLSVYNPEKVCGPCGVAKRERESAKRQLIRPLWSIR